MWIRALNGNVIEVPDEFVGDLTAQGHEAFDTEDEARGVAKPPAPKRPVTRKA